jgi:RNA polymerase subunit RPABC4/transcription elongation factor Spt4
MSGHFCQKCGALLEEDDIFCHSCGTEQRADISGGSEITPDAVSEAASAADAPEIANEPAPPPEHGKFCAFCGALMHLGDRFCEKCGRDQSASSGHAKTPQKRKNGCARERKGRPIGLVLLAIFWSLLGFGFYTAYKTFWNDIPWDEVIAVVTGRRSDDNSEGPVSDRTDDFPPIAPADESTNAQSAGDVNSDDAPAAEGPVVWTERDAAGRSRLVIIGEGGERPASLPGSVTGNRIRLRSEPNSNSKILGVLSRGDILEVIGRCSSGRGKFHWYNVNHGDLSGWMYGEYVRVEEKEN